MRILRDAGAIAAAGLAVMLSCSSAKAEGVSNINLSTYDNGNWSTEINGSQIAAAPTNGNNGTGITFGNYNGNSFLLGPGGVQTIATGSIALNSDAVVNALFNTYYGAYTTEAVITFTNSLNQTDQFSLVAGQTIRDYNNDGYPNGLSGSNSSSGLGVVTAQEWWNNGGNGQRLDAQTFVLPTSWNGTTLTSMQISNPGSSGADDILSAVQVDDIANVNPAPVPEPGTLLMLGTGSLGLLGAVRRRVRRT